MECAWTTPEIELLVLASTTCLIEVAVSSTGRVPKKLFIKKMSDKIQKRNNK